MSLKDHLNAFTSSECSSPFSPSNSALIQESNFFISLKSDMVKPSPLFEGTGMSILVEYNFP